MSEEDIAAARNTPAFCEMMRFEVERAREWFQQGLPLVGQVDRELAIDIELFSRGGQEILNAIERQDYAVLGRRPAISKTRKLALVARAALGKLRMSAAVQQMPCAVLAEPIRKLRSPTRCAAALRARRPRISTTPFWFCPRPSARRCARSMPSCGAAMTSPTTASCLPYERRQKLEAWLDAFHRAASGTADR